MSDPTGNALRATASPLTPEHAEVVIALRAKRDGGNGYKLDPSPLELKAADVIIDLAEEVERLTGERDSLYGRNIDWARGNLQNVRRVTTLEDALRNLLERGSCIVDSDIGEPFFAHEEARALARTALAHGVSLTEANTSFPPPGSFAATPEEIANSKILIGSSEAIRDEALEEAARLCDNESIARLSRADKPLPGDEWIQPFNQRMVQTSKAIIAGNLAQAIRALKSPSTRSAP